MINSKREFNEIIESLRDDSEYEDDNTVAQIQLLLADVLEEIRKLKYGD